MPFVAQQVTPAGQPVGALQPLPAGLCGTQVASMRFDATWSRFIPPPHAAIDCNGNGVADQCELDRSLIYVDQQNTLCEDGTLARPYDTINEGYSAVDLNGTLRIYTGPYSAKPSLSKPMRVEAVAGVVRIGP